MATMVLLGPAGCGKGGQYTHDPAGDTALPYKHDPAGDTALPYKHDTAGDKALPYKHDPAGVSRVTSHSVQFYLQATKHCRTRRMRMVGDIDLIRDAD